MKSTARLYVLLARGSSQGVIFRRGPSSQVLLIKWNLDDDSFESGQWLKGRIYERRCDLSPDGDLRAYFASDFRRSIGSWTAISRPPFFTALALWPKGNCWGGGGHFASNARFQLNHSASEMSLAPNFSIPRWLSVSDCGDWTGRGEDAPIWPSRLLRDGWKLVANPEKTKDDYGAKVWIEYDPPIKWEKAHPLWPDKYTLSMSIFGIMERNGPWYVTEHLVAGVKGYNGAIGGVSGPIGHVMETFSSPNLDSSIACVRRGADSVRLSKASKSPISMASSSSVQSRLQMHRSGLRAERNCEGSKRDADRGCITTYSEITT